MNRDITINTNWKQVGAFLGGLLTVAAMIVVGFWQVNAIVFGDAKADVREIRQILERLEREDQTIRDIIGGTKTDLREQIYKTAKVVVRNEVALRSLKENVSLIRVDIGDIKDDVRLIRTTLVTPGGKQ